MNIHYLRKFRKKVNKLFYIEECDDKTYSVMMKGRNGGCITCNIKTIEEAFIWLGTHKWFYVWLLCMRERAFRDESIFY